MNPRDPIKASGTSAAFAAALFTMALGACATGSSVVREPDARDPVLGYWTFVEAGEGDSAARPPEAFPHVGSSLLVEDKSLAPYMKEGVWARMEIRWLEIAPPRFTGAYLGQSGKFELSLDGRRLVVSEDGRRLGIAERPGPDEERRLAEIYAALPTLDEMRAKATACFAAYLSLRPEETAFSRIDPSQIYSTASLQGPLELAQASLLRSCEQVPPACQIEPMLPSGRTALEALKKACAERGDPRSSEEAR
ncbi:MAG: hypothetical protein ACOX6T_22505 [Myxococcales bacterium]